MKFQIVYQAPGAFSGTLIERGIVERDPGTTPSQCAVSILQQGGFQNPLTGKFVSYGAILQIDAITS